MIHFHLMLRFRMHGSLSPPSTTKVHKSLCKVHVRLVRFLWNLNFLDRFIEKQCSDIKFNENPSSGSRIVPCGRFKLIVALRSFANAPKTQFSLFCSAAWVVWEARFWLCLSLWDFRFSQRWLWRVLSSVWLRVVWYECTSNVIGVRGYEAPAPLVQPARFSSSLNGDTAHRLAFWSLSVWWANMVGIFLGAFAEFRKATVSLVVYCLFVRPHGTARPPPGRIFVRFDISGFFENLPRKLVSLKSDKNNGYFVHEEQNAFMIISTWILHRKRNASEKSSRENQNTFYVQ
jgi:hypothetical protein